MWCWKNSEGSAEKVSPSFSSRQDAEAFMTTSWEDLLDSGVQAVSLYHDEALEYGPMPLEPA